MNRAGICLPSSLQWCVVVRHEAPPTLPPSCPWRFGHPPLGQPRLGAAGCVHQVSGIGSVRRAGEFLKNRARPRKCPTPLGKLIAPLAPCRANRSYNNTLIRFSRCEPPLACWGRRVNTTGGIALFWIRRASAFWKRPFLVRRGLRPCGAPQMLPVGFMIEPSGR